MLGQSCLLRELPQRLNFGQLGRKMDATSFFIACTAGHTADDHMVATERPGRICGRTTCVQHGAKLFLLLGVELNCLQPLRPWGACRAEAYLGRSRNMARPNSAKVWVVSEPDRGAWSVALIPGLANNRLHTHHNPTTKRIPLHGQANAR